MSIFRSFKKCFKKYRNNYSKTSVTRSYGLLEYFLAIERARLANRFISSKFIKGTILDIGCGRYPIFLLTSKFVKKFGIDKTQPSQNGVSRRFNLINYDIESGTEFPFDNNSVNAITMLAVMEHIESAKLSHIMSEVYRILKPGGLCMVTIPNTWAEWVLTVMSNVGLISKIEISDHKSRLENSKILQIFNEANFTYVKYGYFESFMNRWFLATKQGII